MMFGHGPDDQSASLDMVPPADPAGIEVYVGGGDHSAGVRPDGYRLRGDPDVDQALR
jgi:hypothetical protein